MMFKTLLQLGCKQNINPYLLILNFQGLLRRQMSSVASEQIRIDFSDGVKKIVLCNAKTRNSLSIAMMQNIMENIKADEDNEELRAIVISGEGPVFSAGHNLKELADNVQLQKQCFNLAGQLMNSIIDSPVPVIAQVDGLAAAAGCQLVAQCDIAICSEQSSFSTPGANFGIFCSTPGVALARTVHKMSALYMLFTGLTISGRDAKEIGLVSKVCHSNQLDEEVKIVCDAIKYKSRDVVAFGKKFYYNQIHHDVKTAYKLGGEKMVQNLQMDNSKEGLRCFIEKRKPQWNCKKS